MNDDNRTEDSPFNVYISVYCDECKDNCIKFMDGDSKLERILLCLKTRVEIKKLHN